MTLRDLKIGQRARVTAVGGEGVLRQHLLDMGLIPGAEVRLMQYAPMGDPIEVLVQGYVLTLRRAEAELISLANSHPSEHAEEDQRADPRLDELDRGYQDSLHAHHAHPGLGEEGKYHKAADGHPLPKGTPLTLALVGQQNSGKTTLFNVLTGSNQHVGNFPGVTVGSKEGSLRGHADARVVDLPGSYSLSPYTDEEAVLRHYLIDHKPQGIINVVDTSNIERNLYLTMQLMELDIPMVLALNMMDEVTHNGGSVRVNEMERVLGIPVVAISAVKDEGIDELVAHALHVARYQERPIRMDFCGADDHGGSLHRCLHSLMQLVDDHAQSAGISARFAASRLVEGDTEMRTMLALTPHEQEMVEHVVLQMEEERGMDRRAAMADMRYTFIRRLSRATVVKPLESKEFLLSKRIDRVLTGRWTALPIFLAVMCLVIWLTIDVLGGPLQDVLAQLIGGAGELCRVGLQRAGVTPAVVSLVADAIFGGVGGVLSFVPIILILFLFLSLIEDSGYMARIAFVTDKLLRKIGLSGRSIVPLLIGLGCSVPAVMAARTLPSARDRRKTILLTPFMSCSAKIAIYTFFTAAFFPDHGALVLISLYLISIVVGIVVALVDKHLGKKGEAMPFVMELPNYRLPRPRNVGHLMWDKTKDFCRNAFTVVFLATIIIWLLQTFNFRIRMVENGEGSMLAWLAGLLTPLFHPMGLDDWRVVTALITGFLAKESVVATMQVLDVTSLLTLRTAIAMLLFCLLYTPCVAAISSIRRELGHRWALFVVAFQCLVAWVVAWIGYLIAGAVMI